VEMGHWAKLRIGGLVGVSSSFVYFSDFKK
jgi:hypothetical protein